MAMLIQNGRVVTAERDEVADVLVEDGKIARVEAGIDAPGSLLPDTEVVDATGKLVFPGFIDPHVHIHLPFMGTTAKDTYETASRAALVGGTTTLIEMVCPGKDDDPWEAYQLWKGKAEGRSACDYGFHMGVTRWDDDTSGGAEASLRRVVGDGVTSLKVFLAYKGAFGVDDAELYRVCTLAKELGLVVTAHCENAELVASRQRKLVGEGKVGPEWHERSRPAAVEAEGVHHFCTFLEMTGAKGYIVHTSNRLAVEAARPFVERGVDVDLETVIPYLTLDETYAQRAGFEGAKYVMSPPIRGAEHRAFLWEALADGRVSTVATDHAPFDFVGQKDMGRPPEGDFTMIPNGIPSVQHRVTLLYTHGVNTEKLSLQRFVEVASTHAAKRFGMYPAKGTIAPGSDADLVVWDPEYRGTITQADNLMNTDYDGFEGFEMVGRPELVTVRGEVMVRGGEFVGELGHGRAVPRRIG